MYSLFLNTIINVAHMAVLVIPLIVLVVVLVVRVMMLWVIVAISPLLVIINVFKKELPQSLEKSLETFSLANILKLLIAPVLISFAVSLSTVFIALIKNINAQEVDTQMTNILGIFELNIQS
jgi:hypothetical protein